MSTGLHSQEVKKRARSQRGKGGERRKEEGWRAPPWRLARLEWLDVDGDGAIASGEVNLASRPAAWAMSAVPTGYSRSTVMGDR